MSTGSSSSHRAAAEPPGAGRRACLRSCTSTARARCPRPTSWSPTTSAGAATPPTCSSTNGAQRVAFAGDSVDIATVAERRRGFRAALAAADVGAGPELTGLHDVAEAARAITSLLLSEAQPDGLFCANNRTSLGALHAFRATGRRIAMVGFDDFEAATVVRPAVSVVSQDVQEMGRRAAEQLMKRINGDRQPPQRVVLPTEVTVRGSERP